MALSETKRAFLAQKYFGQNLPPEQGGQLEPEPPYTPPAEEPPPPITLEDLQNLASLIGVTGGGGGAPGDRWVTTAEKSEFEQLVDSALQAGLITPEEAVQAYRAHLGLAPKATAPRAAAPVVFSPRELGLVTPSDLLALLLAERQREEEARQDLVDTLLGLAPRLAAGQTFYGGFGPYGGATLLELLQGGPGAPRPIAVQPVPIQTPEDIAARRAENEELIRAAVGAAGLSFAGG